MVKFFLLISACLSTICFTSCNVDLFGVFGSGDLAARLEERNNFRFLTGEDRAPSLGDEFSFIVLTDTHIEDGDTYGLENLKTIVEQNSEIKFAVITGDITQYGDAEDIEKFLEIASSLGIPCYPGIGNHDVYFDNWPEWKTRIGSTCYRINGDTATLFVLDSANAFFGKEQLDWLESEINSSLPAGGRIFVFSHANIFVESPADFQHFTDTKERARLISILRDKCDIMFMGHVHKRIITEAGNVKYISIEDYRSNRVYCIVSVGKSGVSYRFERL